MKRLAYAPTVLLTAFLLASCFFFPDEEPILAPPVIMRDEVTYVTYTAKRGEIVSRAVTTGYVVSRAQADCFFTDYTGNLKTVYPRPGDFVEKGDLIAELDVGELDFDLEAARLNAELAALTYAATGAQTDKLEMELAQNAYEQYQNRMDGSKIYAPASGRVSFVERLNPGEEINPYRVLVRIIDPDDLHVAATLTDVNVYAKGDAVEIKIGGDGYAGVITRTPRDARDEGAEDANALWADFAGEAPTFSDLGKLADIILILGKSENAVIIPKNLVKNLDGKTYVQIFEDGEKRDVEVAVGISNATETEIVSGLEAGQQVVVK
ncbi:MAG: efflux RND transporter periplasmic adaptor subunit [Oscillospiraceae bacterium]|jgi:multidrug efflux pump subunit AcrA (membrane-fusion protein)|nr:efflux RND transporter periplasmic adaptor subunit [Oscillospiraceae bacterium]